MPVSFDRPQWSGEETKELLRLLGEEGFENPVESLEARLGFVFGRARALVVPSPSIALYVVLSALGISEGSEVIASPFSWFGAARGIPWSGAKMVVSDIDSWSFTLDPEKAGKRITERTRAIVVGNTLGHPADWKRFEALKKDHPVVLIEDSTEALFSEYHSRRTGSLGDVSILAFGSPHPNLGESYAVILTDREDLDLIFRAMGGDPRSNPLPCPDPVLSLDLGLPKALARIALASLSRLPGGLNKRALLLEAYQDSMRSFEGVKDLYQSPDVERVNWFSYMVHLGTRFSVLSRNAIVDDLRQSGIEARPFPGVLHLDPWFVARGYGKGMAPIAEKLSDRAIALPFHPGMTTDETGRIVERFKESAVNVGAGAAIY
jgi:dTDP-4-amino-4,6-dideoxygalactose transaminase